MTEEHRDAIRELEWMDRFYTAQFEHMRELSESRRESDQLAIDKALESSIALGEKHNDLIRAGEKKDESYATKADLNRMERWQSKMVGGMMVLGAIGIGNLVKIWLS